MGRELRTEIEIAAPAERVWRILTDFDAYPDWNPFIKRIQGRPEASAKLTVQIEPPGRRAMTFKPTVLEAESNRELRWLGRLLLPGLFDGEHALRIEPAGDGHVRFVQSERFSGVLVPLFGKVLEQTRQGFMQMNEALKRRAEGSSSG